MKQSIYVVVGSARPYHDDEWSVAAYGDSEQAEAHAKALNDHASKMAKVIDRAIASPGGLLVVGEDARFLFKAGAEHSRLDPAKPTNVAGSITSYRVLSIPLFRHFDEFQGLE